jgi:FlaA1/EpsC-like NDP-sugar epimerase
MIPTLSLFQVRVSKFAILLGDVLAFACAFAIATFINVMADPSQNMGVWFSTQDLQRYVAWAGLVFLGLMLFLMRFQHYSDRRPFWDELGDILRLTASLALLDMTLVASTRWNSSRMWWLMVWLIAVVMIVWGRMFTRLLLKQFGLWTRPTIIIGHGPNATDAAIALQSEPRMGFQVAGYVDVDQARPSLELDGRTLQNFEQLQVLADQPGIQWVIALEHAQSEQREHWLRTLAQWGATDINVIPAMRGVPLYGTDMSHFFSHEVALLRVRNNLRRWQFATDTNAGNVTKPETNTGEENFTMGQDWQYCLGNYNGEQNNNNWKFYYATDSGTAGVSGLSPTAQAGQSSAICGWRQ